VREWKFVLADFIFIDYCAQGSAEWCLRATDDVFLNMRAFPGFERYLAGFENPRNKTYVFGNCQEPGGRSKGLTYHKWFLQGGTGFIFSKFAAERFMEFGEEWAKGVNTYEDVYMTGGLKRLGLTSFDCSSPFLVGHGWARRAWNGWEWKRPSFMPCGQGWKKTGTQCGNGLMRMKDIAFYHSLDKGWTHAMWRDLLDTVPDNAMMYLWKNFQPVVCERDNLTVTR
jgi:hypothetical protein